MRHLPAGRWRFFISRSYKVQATALQRRNPADVDKSGSPPTGARRQFQPFPGLLYFANFFSNFDLWNSRLFIPLATVAGQ
jgi:hypothetical protein